MNLFFWKNNKLIDAFANELAMEFYSTINPQLLARHMSDAGKKKDRKLEKTLGKAIQAVVTRINDFRFVHKLGIYGKARLHLKFKVRLVELGYPEDLVEQLNKSIMVETP